MSYKVVKFDVEYNKDIFSVSVHIVTDGADTNHIVSIDDHENFEIKSDKDGNWQGDDSAEINKNLLMLITDKYKGMQP